MDNPFSPKTTPPNMALRKPSLIPDGPGGSSPPKHSVVSPVHTAGTAGLSAGHPNSPITLKHGYTPVLPDSSPQAPKVHCYCIFCGQQGKFRCKRCKNASYCCVECQGKDWMAHRHICKPADPEPAIVKPIETEVSPVLGRKPGLLGSEPCDASKQQRIFMKDLPVPAIKEMDIQAKVVQFYNPGRFFLLGQNPEVMEALQIITIELQNTYSFKPATSYMPCVGEVCAVQYSFDKNWYRGLVQAMTADQKMAHILYIDFGNEESVPLGRIKQLATKIQPFCPCVMECSIARVVPVGGSWSAECCIAVRQLLADRIITVHLVETLGNGRIHAVDIKLSMGKLSTFLIEHGYATENNINVTPAEQEIHELMNAALENFKRLSDGKDDNSWAKPPEPLTQAVGDSFSVVVTHLQSPSDFIVQKVENAKVIQELQLKLREHCYQVTTPQNFRPAPGTVCCAQFSEDKQWYRAKILAYSSEERVCVGYLDFGNSEDVDIVHLRPISSSLLATPMQTVPCGLAGVQPVGENWSEECILALKQRVYSRILCMEIQGAHEGRASVVMIDKASDPQDNVAELLISAGFAAPVAVTTSVNPQADHKAPEVHVPSASSEVLAWSCAELPFDGQTVSLLASVVKNPQEFYCHINNQKALQQLKELGAELKKHCAANSSSCVPKVGEPCCAMISSDGEWYRVMVDILSETTVSVNFVDYGYSMKLPTENLRPITLSLLTLPFQAVRCSLSGVAPLGSEWSSEAKQWFESQVDGELLTARVLFVSERGYEVKLEIRGRDVAAALISEQLARAPGAIPKMSCVRAEFKLQENMYESQLNQEQVQVPGQSGSISKEIPTEGPAAQSDMQLEFPSFPVDWKAAELPLSETFRPCIAAIISPSLFYVLRPIQVNQQKLQGMMTELAFYCSSNNSVSSSSSSSSSVLSRVVPGAVCCAQFSADNIWYRAVVLEVGENEVKVIYADYGNTEMVPFSRILPIPKHLLQIPFQITRCTLTGKEHFPAVWPEEVQHTFQTLLSKGVLATVESFDGFANVLSLCLDTKSGRRQLTAVMLDALQDQTKVSQDQTKTNQDQTKTNQDQTKTKQDQTKTNQDQTKVSQDQTKTNQDQTKTNQDQTKVSQDQTKVSQDQTKVSQDQTKVSQDQTKTHLSSFSQMPEQTGSSAAVIPHSPQPKSMSVTQMGPEEAPSGTCQIISTEPVVWTPQLEKNTPAPSVPVNSVEKIVEQIELPWMTNTKADDLQTPTCCCVSLKTQISHLEHLAQLQLSLIKQILQKN